MSKAAMVYAIDSFVKDLVSIDHEIAATDVERALRGNRLRITPDGEELTQGDVDKSIANALDMLVAEAEGDAEKMRPLGESGTVLAISIEALRRCAEELLTE